MTFRELLEKYKEGALTEEEKKLVEGELEKNEAINDYLAEKLDITSNFTSTEETQSDITTKKVRKTVNRKLFKVVALSVIIVFIILLSVKYIVSPLVASQYYNPSKHTMEKFSEDFLYDLRALNEVVNPGYGISYASAQDNGFGNYSLNFKSTNLFTGESSSITGSLNQNQSVAVPEYFMNNFGVTFNPLWIDTADSEFYDENVEIALKKSEEEIAFLKKLPNTSYVSAYMLLEKNLTLEELRELMYKYKNLKFNWCAVKVSNKRLEKPIGFRITPYGDCSGKDTSYYKKYPALLLSDYFKTNDPDNSAGLLPGYRKHFLSLLQYLSDHSEVAETLTHFDLNFDEYLSYVKSNGINIYGVLVFGSPEALVSLYENEHIKSIDIDNVLPSIYSTKYSN